jgi:hypothetical protein
MRALVAVALFAVAGCQCGGTVLVKSGPDERNEALRDAGMAGGMAMAGGAAGGTAGGVAGGSAGSGPDYCASDCDCPETER